MSRVTMYAKIAIGAIADTIIWDRYCPKNVSSRSMPSTSVSTTSPRAVAVEVPWSQAQCMLVHITAQLDLDEVRSVMADGVLPVLEEATDDDQSGYDRKRHRKSGKACLPCQDLVDYHARHGQARYSSAHRDQTKHCSEQYPESDATSQAE